MNAAEGWSATLTLRFAARAGRTAVVERTHSGPLQVQRAFYPPGDAGGCHVYLLHPPGGLVAGDVLDVRVAAEPGARALLTTPAATKVYRSGDGARAAGQRIVMRAAAGAVVEWLPQETIVYDGARVELETRMELEDGAAFVGWEVLCLGRPAAGERFASGGVRQRFEIWRDGVPRCVERTTLGGSGALLGARHGLAGAPVTATMVATPAGADLLPELRALAEALPSGSLAAATAIDDVVLCRYLGPSAAEARALFGAAWASLRPRLLGRAACAPRIWAT